MDQSKLILSGIRALWGIVTPNIRRVFVEEQNNIISIYFYYDNPPSEMEIDLSEDAASEIIADFPEPFLINCERQTCKFPNLIDGPGILIYSRYE